MRQPYWFKAFGLSVLLSAGGCTEADPEGGGGGGARDRDVDVLDQGLSARLESAADCPDLLKKLQDDALAKLDLEIELFKQGLSVQRNQGAPRRGDVAVSDPPSLGGPTGGAGGAAGEPLPPSMGSNGTTTTDDGNFAAPQAPNAGIDSEESAGDASKGESGGGAADPIGGSDTNNQVKEVDEADFVKMVEDKTRFYLLHGTELRAFDAWPAEDLAQHGQPQTIEGNPREMFVRDGKIVVFSMVNPYDFGLANGAQERAYQSYAKVTVLEVDEDANSGASVMNVTRELYFEGRYTSSRRHDDLVRVVLQAESPAPHRFYPEVEVYDAWGRLYDDEAIDSQLDAWRERTALAIENTELSDWLPRQYARDGGELVALDPACDAHYTPLAGTTDYGLTRVVTLDMQDDEVPAGGLTVLGASSTVYSNLGALVLAHNDYRWEGRDFGVIDEQRTALHTFALDSDETRYTGSGWAPGHVLNQFALGEKDGVVRVSTSGWQRANPDAEQDDPEFWNTEPVNQVLTFAAKDGKLEQLDTTGPIGHEGETTRSTRFIGDLAYVVTFRQTDPLIVVDLGDPKSLEVLGELEIPGFSEYIHPLGDGHLLTIGRDGDQEGRVAGIALQIFDVQDPLMPRLAHKESFSPRSSSAASYDHKAFTFYEAQDLLAFPMVDYGNLFQSTLQVYRVSPEDGFEALGAVDHSALFEDCVYQDGDYRYFECGYQPDVRRGMFVQGEDDTFVYTVSFGGITTHSLGDLQEPLATVDLPQPKVYYEDGYYDGPVVGDDRGVEVGGGWAEPSDGIPVDPDVDVFAPDDRAEQDAGAPTSVEPDPPTEADAGQDTVDGGVGQAEDTPGDDETSPAA